MNATTVGNLLREQLRNRPQQQKEIAFEWLHRWRQRHPGDDWSIDSMKSSLSRCLNDQLQGVKFFFGEEERATVLLDVLEVDESDRASILDAARQMLEKATAEPRVVIDCTPWTDTDSATVLGVIMVLLGAGLELGAVVVLVTKEQVPQIPLGLTDLADVRYEVVSSPAQERVRELASDTALVVSKQRQDKLEYWMALDVVEGKVKMHPEHGLAIFAENQALPALPKVEHPLQDLGVRAAESVELPHSTVEVRRWMFELADANSTVSARRQPDRLALANKLGVCATSTPNERDMYERSRLIGAIEKLGVEFNKKAKQAQLDEAIVQRSERELPPTAMLINNEIHVVFDAKKPVAGLPESPLVNRHPITTRIIIREILEELADWGEDDHFADPHLDGLIGRIPPVPSPHRLRDAQAFLLLSGTHPKESSTVVADPIEALQAVLRGAVPATEVMIPVGAAHRPSSREKAIWWTIERPQFTKPDRASAWQHLPLATTRFPVGRSTRLMRCDSGFDGWSGTRHLFTRYDIHEDHISPYSTITDAVAKGESFLARFGGSNNWEETRTVAATPKAPWDELDVEMGQLWLALLVAMRQPRLTMLHDGSALLALNAGVIARVRARTRPTKLEPPPRRACFVGELDSSHNLMVHRDTVCTMQADAGGVLSKLLETLPREIILHGGGYEVRVSFTASHLVGPAGLDAREFATLAAITVQQLRQQEEEQRKEQQRLDEQREFEEQLRLDEERRQFDDDDDDEY